MDLSGNPILYAYQLEALPPPPDVLSFADLLHDQSIVQAKEQADKQLLESIGTTPVANLRPKFVEWVLKGCPYGFPLISLDIQPPARCSDGEVRNLAEYIEFCSGKTIDQHVDILQAKLPDITISVSNIQGKITVVAIRA